MRNSIFILACLALFSINTVIAETPNSVEPSTVVNLENKNNTGAAKKVMALMSDRNLDIAVSASNNKLLVNLSGSDEKLDWVIFQPKGKVISRISTSSKIDEIKIDKLVAGKYVLMIKDASGRTLFQTFTKS